MGNKIKDTAKQCPIERRRRALGLSREELARQAHLGNPRALEQWEQGRTNIGRASALFVFSVAKVLRCSPIELMDLPPDHDYFQIQPSLKDVKRVYHILTNTQRMTEYRPGCLVDDYCFEFVSEYYTETDAKAALTKLRNTVSEATDGLYSATEYWIECIYSDDFGDEVKREFVELAKQESNTIGKRRTLRQDVKIVCGYHVHINDDDVIEYGLEKDDAGNLVKTYPYVLKDGKWEREHGVKFAAFRAGFYKGTRKMMN